MSVALKNISSQRGEMKIAERINTIFCDKISSTPVEAFIPKRSKIASTNIVKNRIETNAIIPKTTPFDKLQESVSTLWKNLFD